MTKWMPIKGDFSKDGENIIFKGITQQSTRPCLKNERVYSYFNKIEIAAR